MSAFWNLFAQYDAAQERVLAAFQSNKDGSVSMGTAMLFVVAMFGVSFACRALKSAIEAADRAEKQAAVAVPVAGAAGAGTGRAGAAGAVRRGKAKRAD